MIRYGHLHILLQRLRVYGGIVDCYANTAYIWEERAQRIAKRCHRLRTGNAISIQHIV